MQKEITYIIVTWNNEKEIEECLKSLFKYSPQNSKVIIVDNNSGDKTTSIISSSFPSVKLIKSEDNLGFAGGNNLALKYVETDYICYLNPDVIFKEDIVSKSVEILENNPEIGIVSCRLENLDGTYQASTFNFANSWTMFSEILHIGRIVPNQLRKNNFSNYYYPTSDFSPEWVIGAEMVLRTIDANSINGFSTEYFMYTEDMDICKKMESILSKSIYYMNSISLVHIGGASENQNVSYNKQKKMFENLRLFVSKFYGIKESRKTLNNMIKAYRIRLILLQIGYKREDKSIQLDKTNQAISILKELVKKCQL
ncbi:glycosyltransferase family 2 protein [Streptococcus parauberis]|uniref:glycosyltransferase family 2 protein n=1 Tax=Streptococcus parauberis TaxID=1348 RepID=UPI000CCE846D|nr:glycosyltransferase family 2 protein [Streptococcus parauberis]PNY18952.1 N-acetylglucosaminyl-diphospho-decaprenol L-rhamnosyltransferase [Streptococcus parauberis]